MSTFKFNLLFLILALNYILIHGASLNSKKQLFNLFSSLMGEEQPELPEIDWNNIKEKKVIKLKMKELELNEKELYEKVENCVKKCLEKINPDRLYRDNCLSKLCDVY